MIRTIEVSVKSEGGLITPIQNEIIVPRDPEKARESSGLLYGIGTVYFPTRCPPAT